MSARFDVLWVNAATAAGVKVDTICTSHRETPGIQHNYCSKNEGSALNSTKIRAA